MPSHNPVFGRGLPNAGQQSAPWGGAPQYGAPQYGAPQYGAPQYGAPQYGTQDPYAAPSPYAQSPYAPATTRYMTMDDVVQKTGLSFLVTVLSAAVTWVLLPESLAFGLAIPAVLVALVLGLVISFKQIANPAATLSYAALQGVAVGAMFGVLALMLVNIVASWIGGGDGLGLRSGGTLSIVFSLVVIGVAAFSLLLDFDMADEAIRRGAPAKFAWYIAFGLLVTVVWLYLEILRLLSYFQDE